MSIVKKIQSFDFSDSTILIFVIDFCMIRFTKKVKRTDMQIAKR